VGEVGDDPKGKNRALETGTKEIRQIEMISGLVAVGFISFDLWVADVATRKTYLVGLIGVMLCVVVGSNLNGLCGDSLHEGTTQARDQGIEKVKEGNP